MGGKMKWKLAVSANWSRDRNSGFSVPPQPVGLPFVASQLNPTTAFTSNL
jgi:hypothetical protein